MPAEPFRVLLIGLEAADISDRLAASPFGPFDIACVAQLPVDPLGGVEAVVLDAERSAEPQAACARLAREAAVLVVTAAEDADSVLAWLHGGADDVLAPDDLAAPAFARRVRAAIERRRRAAAEQGAWATDLATGLPHRRQLIEHMSQLLALREREPAPMAVVVLRVEGFVTTATHLGAPSADVLRRKLAVRLRAAVRASDVVAALDDETYAVLLGALLAPADGERVAAKLARLLLEPVSVGGVGIAVAVATGIGVYPADGTQPDELLRKAIGMAIDSAALGRVGLANFEETGPGEAANDP
jgi:diguanylate cyclase (GGDEF)-like protein